MPVDPAIQPFLDAVRDVPPPDPSLSPAERRAMAHQMMERSFFALAESGPEVAGVTDRYVPVSNGQIAVRVYTPFGVAPHPAHLYIHGGGFFMGTLDHFDATCRELCVGADCVVVSVDYRLAPEHKFPTPPEDCYAALCWTFEHADELGIDTSRVSVGGGSAGGNLAAVTALMARDRGGPSLVFQLVEIPVTDLTMSHPSIVENGEGYMLTVDAMKEFTAWYIASDADLTNPYASPFFADDLTDLPPALVMTAEFDPLRDEGEAYAQRLSDAGVPTRLKRWDGHIHGAASFTKVLPSARDYRADAIAALREAYGTA
jgi:acetyl esterase